MLTHIYGGQEDNGEWIFISVITVRGNFLLVRFDVVQPGRLAIPPGQIYTGEGLSESTDRHSLYTTRRNQLVEKGSAPSSARFP